MLKEYKKKHAKLLSQNLIVSAVGKILESDNTFFNATSYNNLEDIHPFFMSLTGLLNTKGEEFVFSCVHLYLNDEEKITDIFLKTFKDDKSPLLIIQDLTGHYKSYQDTAQTRNESIISKQALALHNDYLSERESFKNTFIANFSHELRDPLTGILTFSNILKKTDLNEEQSNYLEVLRSSTNYLKKMIDDILDISKIEAGKLDLILEPFDILALLNELKVVYTAKAKNKGLNFTYDFNENLPKIIGGDVLRLRQVLTSLLDNAIKFTEKGTVNLSVSLNQIRAQKASIHFKITDTGIGISEEELENIFNSFTQVNNPQSFKGNGLGLAISQYLVGLTNSTIKVKSEVGKGSTFSTNINFALDLSKS